MGLLDDLAGPDDLRQLDKSELAELAEEIRVAIVAAVARTAATSDRTSAWSS